MLNGKKIKELRNNKGLSMRVTAALVTDEVGKTVTYEAIRAIEAGEWDLSLEKSVALARVLGVPLADILIGSELRESFL